ncbi:hypothetical protein AAU57_12065 [Nonlabens sp. YIK11]|uniref:HNH endonuclease signature motif containing protein n=1 Tax=Nonlabens sp. YIK11 TaxID=1453349 RepID=UPI0006DC048A|nr:HNH endonuclease signature motif containing protein [Nonlabens sp. YIK11]KQC33983.1 hypothetical protein AAU57_12065 [Nonlabens sp. YIK11]
MRKHTQIYMDALGFDKTDFMPCELSCQQGIDVHHVIGRGKGGEDRIENLMLLTRELHHKLGDKKEHMVYLLTKHMNYLAVNSVDFDIKWFDEKIKYYKAIAV